MFARKLAPSARILARSGSKAVCSSWQTSPGAATAMRLAGIANRSASTSSAQAGKGPGKTPAQRAKGAAAAAAGPTVTSSQPAAASVGAAARRKLNPAAKAKAQASASRALREQIRATIAKGGEEAEQAIASATQRDIADEASVDEVVAAIAREQLEDDVAISQPIRRLRDVVAFATAEEYDLNALMESGRLPANWQLIEDGEVIYVPHWPPLRQREESQASSSKTAPEDETPSLATSLYGGEAFIFRSGSYVTWGMSEEQSRKFLRSVIRGRNTQGKGRADGLAGLAPRSATTLRPVEIAPYEEIGDEAMEFIMTDDQVTRIVGDLIVLGRAPRSEEEEIEGSYTDEPSTTGTPDEDADWTPLLARIAFSQGLARSARLSVQEAELSSYLEEVATVPGRLEAEGKVPMARRQVIRKMGTLLKLRQRANLDDENFLDDPEMYWDNALLENHYDSICVALDIEGRFNAYNEKLDHGENLLGVLRALLTESSTHRMELIIIYLIAFEVCLALIAHDYIPTPSKVMDFFTGKSDSLGAISDPSLLTANLHGHQSMVPDASAQTSAAGTNTNTSSAWWDVRRHVGPRLV